MKVIAIDPGYDRIGIAVLEKNKDIINIIFSECFFTNRKDHLNDRILDLGLRIDFLIKKYKPNYLAIEGLFFSKNTKTALSVAEARGVIIFQAKYHNLPVFEYTPNQIKVAVTGYGNANKNDIFFMVKKLIKIDNSEKKVDDELDAIAIGLTFFASYKSI